MKICDLNLKSGGKRLSMIQMSGNVMKTKWTLPSSAEVQLVSQQPSNFDNLLMTLDSTKILEFAWLKKPLTSEIIPFPERIKPKYLFKGIYTDSCLRTQSFVWLLNSLRATLVKLFSHSVNSTYTEPVYCTMVRVAAGLRTEKREFFKICRRPKKIFIKKIIGLFLQFLTFDDLFRP